MYVPSGEKAVIGRLRDWWHGEATGFAVDDSLTITDSIFPAGDLPAGAAAAGPPGGVIGRTWDADGLAAVQMVCGAGSSIPGGDAFAVESIKPLGLKETMNVVDHGAQLGQFARAVARTTGAWVDAYEPDAELADEAARLARESRLGKKVAVSRCGLPQVPVKPQSRDAVIAVEVLHRAVDRAGQMVKIAGMLKPGGRLMLLDYFRQTDEPTSPAIERWRAHELLPRGIPTLAELRKAMAAVGLRIQVSQDVTTAYSGNVTAGLRTLARQLSQHPPDSAVHGALLREVEFWGARLAALQSGDIAVNRVVAALPGRPAGD